MEWQKCSGASYPKNAFNTGAHDRGSKLFVARAFHKESLIPGKFVQGHKSAYVPWGGFEHAKDEYEVLLLQKSLTWVQASSDHLPLGALPIGHENGVQLYSIKGKVDSTDVLGKYHSQYKTCFFPYGGKEHEKRMNECEILCGENWFTLEALPFKPLPVPQPLLQQYHFTQEHQNPMTEAAFILEAYKNCFEYFKIGFFSIGEYKEFCQEAINTMNQCADHLDKVACDTGITKTVGGGASIGGSVMAIAGIVLAPFTGGLSTALTVAGTSIAVAGGVTSITGTIIEAVWEGKDKEKFQKQFSAFKSSIELMNALTCEFIKKRDEADKFMRTDKGKALAILAFRSNDLSKSDVFEILNSTYLAGNAAWKGYKTASSAKNTYDVMKSLKALKEYQIAIYGPTIVKNIGALSSPTAIQMAKGLPAPGLSIPSFVPKFGGKCFLIWGGGLPQPCLLHSVF